MATNRNNLVHVLTVPVLTAGLLAGIVWEKQGRLKPDDAAPYHAQAKAAVEAIPYIVGYWTGRDHDVPEAAQKLLKPNVILSRLYTENRPGSPMRHASLLIVQCRDSRDMIGHYPPICYVAHGAVMQSEQPADWQIGQLQVPGTEYCFGRYDEGRQVKQWVRNFLVVPGAGIQRDMDGVLAAAEDYRRRFFGAAQFQLVMEGDLSQQERDEIFNELMAEVAPAIRAVSSSGAE